VTELSRMMQPIQLRYAVSLYHVQLYDTAL